jgi:hypothetical protein
MLVAGLSIPVMLSSHRDPAVPVPAFFHHERIRGLKSSANSAILIERTFKMK